MVLATWQPDGIATIYLRGDLDIATAPELRTAVDDVLDAGARQIVFDGSRVDFIDLRGIQPVLHARQRLRVIDDATRVWWQRPALCVRRLLEVTGLGELVPSAATG